MEEIVEIATRIRKVWWEIACLTKLFEEQEINEISNSRVNEEETRKALTMLTRYMEREGTRKRLAEALDMAGLVSLSLRVRSGFFICTGWKGNPWILKFQIFLGKFKDEME